MKLLLGLLLSIASSLFANYSNLSEDYKEGEAIITKFNYKRTKHKTKMSLEINSDKPISFDILAIILENPPNGMNEIPPSALAMLTIPPPPPRDCASEPRVQFEEGVSKEFIAWATMPKQQAKR